MLSFGEDNLIQRIINEHTYTFDIDEFKIGNKPEIKFENCLFKLEILLPSDDIIEPNPNIKPIIPNLLNKTQSFQASTFSDLQDLILTK